MQARMGRQRHFAPPRGGGGKDWQGKAPRGAPNFPSSADDPFFPFPQLAQREKEMGDLRETGAHLPFPVELVHTDPGRLGCAKCQGFQ